MAKKAKKAKKTKDAGQAARRRAILAVVETQIRDNNPPATAATLKRLIDAGHSREQAMELIACVLVQEMHDVMSSGTPYNEARYLAGLRALPRLPWDDEP